MNKFDISDKEILYKLLMLTEANNKLLSAIKQDFDLYMNALQSFVEEAV